MRQRPFSKRHQLSWEEGELRGEFAFFFSLSFFFPPQKATMLKGIHEKYKKSLGRSIWNLHIGGKDDAELTWSSDAN